MQSSNIPSVTNSDSEKPTEKKSFPCILFDILDDERNSEIIRWTPDGAGFTIFSRKRFETEIIPKYFEGSHTKYSSFTRRLHRWNFIQRAEGHGVSNFYHEMFSKGNRELAARIVPESRTEAEDTSANMNRNNINFNAALLNQMLQNYGRQNTGIQTTVFSPLPLGMNPSHYVIPTPIVEGLVQQYPELCNYVIPVAMNQIDSQVGPLLHVPSVNPTNQSIPLNYTQSQMSMSQQMPFSNISSAQHQHPMTSQIPGSFSMPSPQTASNTNLWQNIPIDQTNRNPFTAPTVVQRVDGTTSTRQTAPQQTAPPSGSDQMFRINIPSTSATDTRGSSTGSSSLTTSATKHEISETDNRSNDRISDSSGYSNKNQKI
jgi:hypothetical protein